MSKEPIPSGEVVDVCECGVFADYFDGEPRALSKLFLLPLQASQAHDDADGVHPCASCGEAMELLRYDSGPLLHRCHACASVFMTPMMLHSLRAYEGEVDTDEDKPTLLGRIARWFESL